MTKIVRPGNQSSFLGFLTHLIHFNMSFRTASSFSEVGIDFPISYKVNKLLLDRLVKKLPRENQEVDVKGDAFRWG